VAAGGAALAGAASNGSASSSGSGSSGNSGSTPQPNGPPGLPPRRPDEKPLTGDTASKVKAAALAKVPGATAERLEHDADRAAARRPGGGARGRPARLRLDLDRRGVRV